MAGFQAGWAFYIARATAFAANMNLLVASMAFFWRRPRAARARIFLLGLVVLLLAVPNVAGTRHGMRSLGLLTVLKFLPLLALVAVGLAWLEPAAFPVASTPLPGYTSFGTAALLVIYAFVGWEGAVVPAGEARNPARDMPRALILAMVVVTSCTCWCRRWPSPCCRTWRPLSGPWWTSAPCCSGRPAPCC
jgi:amino acid transporter